MIEAPVADKRRVARDFSAAALSYDGAARLQRQVGQGLLRHLRPGPVSRILDLGCGTGLFTGELSQRFKVADVMALDLASGMLDYARERHGASGLWCQGDAEQLPLAAASIDRLFSSLMVQWCDLGRVLGEVARVLRPGGQALLSTLLDGTLAELASAWRQVDPVGEHVNRFLASEQVEQLLQQRPQEALAGHLQQSTLVLDYADTRALMRELKALGARHKGSRGRALTAGGLRALERAYRTQSGQQSGPIRASYQVGYLILEKPVRAGHVSQR